MKKTLAAATVAALVGVVGAANAADLYKGSMKDTGPAPYVPPPAVWTGFYLGGHVGGAWSEFKNRVDHDENYVYDSFSESWNSNNDGVVFGGGTLGYNYQTGAFVFGFESDFGLFGFNNDRHWDGASWDGGDHHFNFREKENASFYADVTGRLGYAAGPVLIYAKGGWAFLENPGSFGFDRVDGNGFMLDGVGHGFTLNNESLNGWTVGGGIEYMWSPSWSVKSEYMFFDFGNQDHDFAFKDGDGCDHNGKIHRELQVNTFKVGLNYHFNNVYTPLK